MQVYVILALLVVGIAAEKKLNLEDIERDNLRAESKSKSENLRVEETKYLTKSEISQQYETSDHYSASTTPAPAYAPPPIHNAKYNVPLEAYLPPNRYAVKELAYQHENIGQPQQNIQYQYYNTYQEQLPLQLKGIAPNVYESQQVVYQPEVPVGNQFQTVQQKAASEKYAKNIHKETVYVDVPMSQLLTYYPNLEISSGRSSGLSGQPVLNQLATAAAQQISIPVYTPAFSQKPIVPVKQSYQVHYTTKHAAAVPTTFTTKIPKGAAYNAPVTSKKFTSSPLGGSSVYLPAEQAYNQGKKYLYTQAYVTPPQQQYLQSVVYTQPAAYYTHASPVYTDLYARPQQYVQDNALHSNLNQYNTQQIYLQAVDSENLPKQSLRQQVSHVPQNYVEDAEEPSGHFIPPRLPAQNFKSGVTQLVAVPSQGEESLPVQHHASLSGPRSLLESYIPSKVIAAQDSERYRERPLKLEGGFLPSKENFIHKKRKSE